MNNEPVEIEPVESEEAFQVYLDRRADIRYRMMDADQDLEWI